MIVLRAGSAPCILERSMAIARAILGIDAAWTAAQPSGVALVVEGSTGWRCAGLAPSYDDFLRLGGSTPVDWDAGACCGAKPAVSALLAAARCLAPGATVVVAAVDMPLALGRISGRRPCDDAVSRAFGARGCGVHTPSVDRPGVVSDRLHRGFAESGFRLATTAPRRGRRHLLEVYPHTALLALTGSSYRLPYKLARSRRYWPEATPGVRRERLLAEWTRILGALRGVISGVELPLPREAPAHRFMKRCEDALDALACAWVGIEFLAGRARALGDPRAAIWSPERGGEGRSKFG
jgi:predicted RNase H-like nuclease